jgi:hypothetical protein
LTRRFQSISRSLSWSEPSQHYCYSVSIPCEPINWLNVCDVRNSLRMRVRR